MDYCENFILVPGRWVTRKRKHQKTYASEKVDQSMRIAVLIGSLLRTPFTLGNLENIIEKKAGIEWHLFIATADEDMPARCHKRLCDLPNLEAVSFVDLNSSSQDEDTFSRDLGSRFGSWSSMRQWFKLARAYELMMDYEVVAGYRFDAVLKTRSDIRFSAPLSLGFFGELSKPVIYGISDILFFCNRKVASSLLDGLLARIYGLRGTEDTLLPIAYERLLDSDLEDTDFFTINYPCLSRAEPEFTRSLSRCSKFAHPTIRIPQSLIGTFKATVLKNLLAFNAVHDLLGNTRSKRMHNASWCSGAWWRNVSARTWAIKHGRAKVLGDRRAVQSGKLWFYLAHSATPGATWRRWPRGSSFAADNVELHPDRHFYRCMS